MNIFCFCSKNIYPVKKLILKISAVSFLILIGGCKNKSGITTPGEGPQVTATSPENEATGVSVTASISARFNEEMNPSTIDSAFTLKQDTQLISGSVNYSDSTAIFVPSNALSFATTYTAAITSEAENLSGDAIENSHAWTFTTVNEPDDDAPPEVVSTNPANGAADISVNTAIIANFSERMNASTINETSFSLSRGTTPIAGRVTYAGTTATFTPANSLDFETAYTVTISTGAEDVAGNALTEDLSWNFSTGNAPDNAAPQIVTINPEDNEGDVSVTTNITATFNEAVNTASISNSTFTVEENDTEITGEFSFSGNSVIFNPANNLDFETIYTVTITTKVEDLAGNNLANARSWQFTTSDEPDNTAPVITATNPADNDQDVPISSNITTTFSEAINQSSVNSGTFTLKQGDTNINGTFSFSGNSVIFNPNGSLSYERTYTATISTGIEDLAGNNLAAGESWRFTTVEAPDNTAPEITAISPLDNQQNVEISTNITATFSEPINTTTVTNNTFVVQQGNTNVPGEFNFSGNSVTFNPSSELDYETNYSISITTGIEDVAGNNLAEGRTWSFTTMEEPDNTAPRVISVAPDDNAQNVPLDIEIEATFSESMDPSAINSANFTLTQGGSLMGGSVDYNETDNTATFDPETNLTPGTTYTATITTGVEDLAGNNLDSQVSWEFTTVPLSDSTAPEIISTDPDENEQNVPTTASINITFSEGVNPTTITASTVILELDGLAISGSLDVNENVVTLTPSFELLTDATYAVTITTGVQDLAGNALESNFAWSFSTENNEEEDEEENDDNDVNTE